MFNKVWRTTHKRELSAWHSGNIQKLPCKKPAKVGILKASYLIRTSGEGEGTLGPFYFIYMVVCQFKNSPSGSQWDKTTER